MNLITRDTDYAVKALVYIAKSDKKLISTAELDEQLKLPRPFMRKIFQTLQQKGILNSVKGSGGGFSLAKNPKDIFVLDIINIFQGNISLAECLFKKDICPDRKTCLIRKKIKSVEKMVCKEFEDVTIASLMI